MTFVIHFKSHPSTISPANQWFVPIATEFGPSSQEVQDLFEVPTKALTFSTPEAAAEFMSEFKAHPWWVKPSGVNVVTEVFERYRRVLDGYDVPGMTQMADLRISRTNVRGWTIETIAEFIGVSVRALLEIERRRGGPVPKKVQVAASIVYSVPVESLFDGDSLAAISLEVGR